MITPEIILHPSICIQLSEIENSLSLESLEESVLRRQKPEFGLETNPHWLEFVRQLSEAWCHRDHAVVRGAPSGNGASALLVGLALGSKFKPYRGDKVVKHFKMSPWTAELSQTLKEGHFHTDLNTASQPPKVTIIQCSKADPTPGAGELRIARVSDLLEELDRASKTSSIQFLLDMEVDMVDERAEGIKTALMVENGTIRFHPETLRAAQNRLATLPHDLEERLSEISEAGMNCSTPIHLNPGDMVITSNTRALHYRGQCTVRYEKFPRIFEAREIYVLHLLDEPEWPIACTQRSK